MKGFCVRVTSSFLELCLTQRHPLFAVRLVGVWQPVPRNGRTVLHFISRAIAANLLFTAGPLADYYISVLLGRRSVLVTGILSTLGTLFTLLVVPISVSWFWSTQYPGLKSFD